MATSPLPLSMLIHKVTVLTTLAVSCWHGNGDRGDGPNITIFRNCQGHLHSYFLFLSDRISAVIIKEAPKAVLAVSARTVSQEWRLPSSVNSRLQNSNLLSMMTLWPSVIQKRVAKRADLRSQRRTSVDGVWILATMSMIVQETNLREKARNARERSNMMSEEETGHMPRQDELDPTNNSMTQFDTEADGQQIEPEEPAESEYDSSGDEYSQEYCDAYTEVLDLREMAWNAAKKAN
ncbi:hypothetical protein QR680_007032 [Steinernema hermaphroditum]|uniref:Uncharacterized protein n=1 Tax=Steinernema hermaphroditum TaxID=289476 RepID=A0AA39HZR9_9BILA|nr:hypothetical protein QR680_007032 [Steinernema hermaphroditum]